MSDPWQVLGVSRSASDDEIKSAYRKLAQKYHPDRNPGDEAAARKMQEINDAYDRIKNPGTYGPEQTASGGAGSYAGDPFGGWSPFGGFGGWQQEPSGSARADDPRLRAVHSLLESRQYDAAIRLLEEIPAAQRTAEWFYCSAVANDSVGNRITALRHAQQAVRLNPNEPKYQMLLNRMQPGAGVFRQTPVRRGGVGTALTGICIANLLCRLCLCFSL